MVKLCLHLVPIHGSIGLCQDGPESLLCLVNPNTVDPGTILHSWSYSPSVFFGLDLAFFRSCLVDLIFSLALSSRSSTTFLVVLLRRCVQRSSEGYFTRLFQGSLLRIELRVKLQDLDIISRDLSLQLLHLLPEGNYDVSLLNSSMNNQVHPDGGRQTNKQIKTSIRLRVTKTTREVSICLGLVKSVDLLLTFRDEKITVNIRVYLPHNMTDFSHFQGYGEASKRCTRACLFSLLPLWCGSKGIKSSRANFTSYGTHGIQLEEQQCICIMCHLARRRRLVSILT